MEMAAPGEMSYTKITVAFLYSAFYIAIDSFAGAKGTAADTHDSLQELAVVQHALQRALCSPNLHSARGRPAAAGQTAGAVRQQVPRRLQFPGSPVSGRETLQPDPRPAVGHASLQRQLLPVCAPVRDSVRPDVGHDSLQPQLLSVTVSRSPAAARFNKSGQVPHLIRLVRYRT